MYGLRVQLSGRSPVTMALNLESYQISACASARWRGRGAKPRFEFAGSGLDDRTDLLKWFSVEPPGVGAWMEITPVETTTADPPRRNARRIISRLRLQRSLARMRREITDLTRRLERPDWRPKVSPVPPPPERADFGLVVKLDDRVIGSAGIGRRGVLSVDVVLKRSPGRLLLMVHVHGGENLGGVTYRWRRWAWGDQRELDVGQRIRIEVAPREQLDLGDIREVRRHLPTTRKEVRARLADLRRDLKARVRSGGWSKEYDHSRPPPRRYPRAPIRAD
jgi:hypothetical protein